MNNPNAMKETAISPIQQSRKRGSLWPFGIIMLFLTAYLLRVWNLAGQELSFDEVATVFVARRSLPGILRYIAQATREHPPLYYLGMSLWFRFIGTTEFAVRYPSALIGILVVAWGMRQGRYLIGNREGGLWAGILLALTPASLWAARTGRMYALVVLLAMMTMSAWRHWVESSTWQRGATFIILSVIGALTHYFLAFLWVAQGLMLLLAPRKTRGIRWMWLSTVIVAGMGLLGLVVLSPGIRKTMVSVLNIFPVRALRLDELQDLFLELTVTYVDPTLLPTALMAMGLIVLGWGLCWHKEPSKGGLLLTWGIVPIAILHFIPIPLTKRYSLLAFPPMVFGIAAALTLVRPHLLRLGLAVLVLMALPEQWQQIYHPLEGTFKQQVDVLHHVACPGDAIVLNGPWPALLFEYYPHPTGLKRILVPRQAPPGFKAEVDIPRLEATAAKHERIWTFYGAIRATDPNYAVSRWFAEHMYAVYAYKSMVLYLPPATTMHELTTDISFGNHLNLDRVSVDRETVSIGEPIRVDLAWSRNAPPTEPALTLALIDELGNVWVEEEFRTGPVHHTASATLPDAWRDMRGLWILPGIPPGSYTLALRVEAQDLQYPETVAERWVPLGPIEVKSSASDPAPNCSPNFTGILPNINSLGATFRNGLGLVGLQPWGTRGIQGYPLGFRLWWKAHTVPDAAQIQVRLRGRETVEFGTRDIAPASYPLASWSPGDVVQQEIVIAIPDDLSAGTYHLEIQMLDTQGAYEVAGSRDALTFPEQWQGTHKILLGTWADLYTFQVNARDRDYTPPLIRRRRNVRFGDVLRLRGYRLSRTQLHSDESAELTIYWEAMKRPSQIYAAFNHLRNSDNQLVWSEDSWPQQGVYTTDHWLEGEVVAETYTLIIPKDTAPGHYPLYIGIYDPKTGNRLPAMTRRGQPIPNNEVKLLEVEVLP